MNSDASHTHRNNRHAKPLFALNPQEGIMKLFKRITALLLPFALISLAGCGSQTPIEPNDGTNPTNSSGPRKEKLPFPTRLPPAVITIKSGTDLNADLRVETNLADLFTVTHPTADSVNVTVTSDKDGVLYDGPWVTGPYSGFVTHVLNKTFSTLGTRQVTVLARVGRWRTAETFDLNLINTVPKIVLRYDGNPHPGEMFLATAQIFDRNEANYEQMCKNTYWTVDAEPGALNTSAGCQVILTFNDLGPHQVRATTFDSEYKSVSSELNLEVTPNESPKKLVTHGLGWSTCSNNTSGQQDFSQGSSIKLPSRTDSNGRCSWSTFIFQETLDRSVSNSYFNLTASIITSDEQGNDYSYYVHDLYILRYHNDGDDGHRYPTGYVDLRYYSDFPGPETLTNFKNVNCRLELKGSNYEGDITVNQVFWVGRCTNYVPGI
jgi:predicted small lipoprotein YifL